MLKRRGIVVITIATYLVACFVLLFNPRWVGFAVDSIDALDSSTFSIGFDLAAFQSSKPGISTDELVKKLGQPIWIQRG